MTTTAPLPETAPLDTQIVLPDVMVGIETIGNGPNGMIVQIGAVRFNALAGEEGFISSPAGCFTFNVKPTGNVSVDGVMDFDTVRWWLKQAPAAQQRVFWPAIEPRDHIGKGVMSFCSWLAEQGPFERVWANPPGFDLRLLREAFERVTDTPPIELIGGGIVDTRATWPIGFRAEADFRTLKHVGTLLNVAEPLRVGVHHDALDDALHQAGWAIKILRAARAKAVTS